MPNVAVVVIVATDDPLLLNPIAEAGSLAPLRSAVLAALPSLSRVVAIMPEDEGKLMIAGHMLAAEDAGSALTVLREHGPSHAIRRRRRMVH
jgi:hypothetical protein